MDGVWILNKRFRWDITYLQWGITALSVLAGGIAVYFVFERWSSVEIFVQYILKAFSPVIYGLLFAYLLGRIKSFIERRLVSGIINRVFKNASPEKKSRASRSLSIILTIGITFYLVVEALLLVLPQLLNSLQILIGAVPDYHSTVAQWLGTMFADDSSIADAAIIIAENVIGRFANWIEVTVLSQAESITESIIDGAITLVRPATNIAVGFVISLYMMYHKEKFIAQLKKILYSIFSTGTANRIVENVALLDRTFGSFITARLIDAAIIGCLQYIFNAIFGMPYPMLIAAIMGLMNIIPFFGPYIGGIPSAVLILLINPMKCLIFVVYVVIVQLLDATVIYPKIQGNSLGLSGFWIISSLMVGGGLFGFRGILLAVPAVAFVYLVLREMVSNRLKQRDMPSGTEEFTRIHIFDEETNEPLYKIEMDE